MSTPARKPAGPPRVALVGAPNAGKSTLFNRLVGTRRALVTDVPGTTRDRLYGRMQGSAGAYDLCDTGGIGLTEGDEFTALVARQTEEAIGEAAVLILVVDGRKGLTPLELAVAEPLRRTSKPVLVAVNKLDTRAAESMAGEFAELGFHPILPISAEHDLGIEDLVACIEAALEGARALRQGEGDLREEPEFPEGAEPEIRVAIGGRPNVGKSSLLNRLAREDRMTVSDVPGTTRDSVDTLLVRGDRRYRFIDTAGLRQRGKASDLPERLSAMTARRTLEKADVVLLVLDASRPLTALDQTVAGYAAEAGRPLILIGNKWDLVEDAEEATKRLRDEVGQRFRFARQAPVITLSAKTGLRAEKVFELIDRVESAARRRIPTPELNRFLRAEIVSGRGPNLLYITQTGTRPPAFVVFTHDAGRVHFSLRRRLENRLRESFDFGPTPIALRFRSRSRRPARA